MFDYWTEEVIGNFRTIREDFTGMDKDDSTDSTDSTAPIHLLLNSSTARPDPPHHCSLPVASPFARSLSPYSG
ncbi:hypothetical protein [Natrialba taiwanensis]|uniref:Uncharacterized protein n=1 Tax=Natrialba taiwanensis DSM 12281 TaxID=1230458 RepID=M0A535_9EURY|nr:hypothetical protein [Natrialba taiwanensis]ELY92458.1 hypothetical protein C484_09139 [Natrialba taiwanensis DSM 12281]